MPRSGLFLPAAPPQYQCPQYPEGLQQQLLGLKLGYSAAETHELLVSVLGHQRPTGTPENTLSEHRRPEHALGAPEALLRHTAPRLPPICPLSLTAVELSK